MELFKPLSPVIPVFLLVLIGFVFAHWKKISLASVTEIIVYLGTPSLVFTSLASKPLLAGDIVVLLSGVVIIFTGVGLLIRVYFLLFQAYTAVYAIGVDGINRQVILLYGALPAAVINFILTENLVKIRSSRHPSLS